MTKEKMNKKKLLHIIHIIYDVLSALFIVFVSSALLINAVQNADKKTQDILTPNIQETKARRDYVKTSSGYYEYGVTDLMSYDFARAVIDYYVNNKNATDLSYERGSTGTYVIQTSGVYSVFFFTYQETYTKAFDVYNIVLSKYNWGNTSFRYEFVFSNASPYDKQIKFEWTCQKNNDQQLVIMGGGMSAIGLSSTADNDSWRARFMLSENASSREAFIYDLANNDDLLNYDKGYQQGYDLGYDDGYRIAWDGYQSQINTAYSNGYDVGYDVGYIDGVDSDGVNAFGLLGQAFDAVSDVLSIEILPGFQLWVLVTTPLIIAVVIVVVKLIKGQIMHDVWNYIQEFLLGMGQFWEWLITPIDELGGWQPISIIGVSGLAVIIGFWIFHLVKFW